MADNKQVVESSTVSQEHVGKVFIVYGTAKAISSDGTTRILAPNSPIYAQDKIHTESDGRLSIVFNDSSNSQLNIGRMSEIVIDEDVYNTNTVDLAEESSEVEEVQEALLTEGFDPTTELEAPAAGNAGASSDGGGHPVVSFDATGEVVVPTSGAETRGVTRDFLDPIGGINESDLVTPSPEPLNINVNLSASSEADEGGLITYTVDLSHAVKKSLTINLSNGASIIIPEGETTGATTLDAPADDPYIDAETLSVNIASIEVGDDQTYIVDKSFAHTDIQDTIDPTTLTLEATPTVEEGSDGIIYTATIANAFDSPPKADTTVALSNGLSITIKAGEMSGSISVPVQGDDAIIDAETVPVKITDVIGGDEFEQLNAITETISTSVTDTINPTTVILTAPSTVTEGSQSLITYTATLDNAFNEPSTEDIKVDLSNGAQITIKAGQMSGSVYYIKIDDAYLNAHTRGVSIEKVTGGNEFEQLNVITDPVSTTVLDTIDPTTVTLMATPAVAEGSEDGITYTVTLDNAFNNAPKANIIVNLSNEHSVLIKAGEMSGSIVVPVQGDDVYIDAENVPVNIIDYTGGDEFERLDVNYNPVSTTVTDTIDTVTVSLSADLATAEEGDGNITYTATLKDADGKDVTAKNNITVELQDGGPITILAGASTGTTTVTIQDDDVYRDGETLDNVITQVTETNAGSPGSLEDLDFDPAPATTIITDTIDTTYVSITGPPSVSEGATTGSYTVTLTNAYNAMPQSDVTVKFSYTGTATDGSDYTGVGSVVVSQGTSSKNFTIDTIDDFFDEGPESIIVTITDVTGGNFESIVPHLTESSFTTIITDNIPPEVGSDTIRISEEGLPGANPDTDGSADTTNATTKTGTVTIGDADSDALTISLSDPIAQLTSGGQPLSWDGTGVIDGSAYTLVGSVGTTDIITITIDNQGNYTVTQTGPIDHLAKNLEDDSSFDIQINVNDGTVTSTGTLAITIEDDSPTIEAIGDLHFVSEFAGYDNAVGTYELDENGNPVNAQIIIESTNDLVGGNTGTNEQLIGTHNVETKLFIIADGGDISGLDSASVEIQPDGTLLINNVATSNDVFYMDSTLNADGADHFKDENGDFINSVPPEGGEIHIEDLPASNSDNDFNDVVLRFEKLPVTVDEANLADGTNPDPAALTVGGNLFSGAGAGFLAISIGADFNGSSLTVTSGGNTDTVYFDGIASNEITVASDVGDLTVRGDGSWSYTLRENSLTHPDNDPGGVDVISDGDSDRGVDDQVQDTFDFIVTDGDGDTANTQFHVNINDDGPEAGDPQDAILAHEVFNTVTGDLDIEFGADGAATTVNSVQLTGKTSVDGSGDPTLYVSDNEGNILTSGGSNLVYHDDGNGGLIAKTVGTDLEVFRITVDPVTETYTVTLNSTIDGCEHFCTNLTTGGIKGGNNDYYDFYTGDDNDNDGSGDIKIHVTGLDFSGNPDAVNSSNIGLGIHNNWIDNPGPPQEDGSQDNPGSETMFMTFTDTTPIDPSDPSYSLTAAKITAGSLNFSEDAVWSVYNTNGSQDQADWTEVNSGSANGQAKFNTTFTVDGGTDPLTGQPIVFDAIMLQAGDGDDYRVLGITTYSRSLGDDVDLTYDLQITDGDGDIATSSFDVTFDADGNITGTSADEVISGSSTANIITGGGGEDVIYGGAGNDTIFAQDGEADIISGGDGMDTVEMDISLDTLIDDPDPIV